MENSNQDDLNQTPAEPQAEEIRGLEETQATEIRPDGRYSDPDNRSPASAFPIDPQANPETEIPGGDQARTVRISDERAAPTAEGTGNARRPAAAVRNLFARIPGLKKTPADAEPSKPRSRWLPISLLGLLALGSIAALSALGGYFSGIALRQNASTTQVALAAREQFELGLQDIEQGNYFRARQRFEYVIQIDPSYPGAVEKLADVLLELNTTATPTLLPTPTLSPTPDLRGVEELFNQGQQLLFNEEWSSALDTLLQLRKTDPEFRKIDVDGMLFLALRNRAKDKILIEGDLEGGIYDLTLAERFGIMDAEGQSLFNWATFYITGASFWEIDWAQAAYYFGQVAPHAPNLRDKSNITALERYRVSVVRYASQLLNQKQFCKAQEQLGNALTLFQDPEIQAAHAQAAQLCSGGQTPATEEPTPAP